MRHHQHHSACGLVLSGRFLYTGDTCPIPEIINTYACQGEIIFHDANTRVTPSHTCIHEIEHHCRTEQIGRMVFYHQRLAQKSRAPLSIPGTCPPSRQRIARAGPAYLVSPPVKSDFIREIRLRTVQLPESIHFI